MRKFLIVLALTTAAAIPASAQKINMDFPSLEERASETVEVTLDASMLRMAAKFLSNSDPEERSVRQMIGGLTGIYVRSYEFDEDNAYDKRLASEVKAQLGPTWKPFVNVRSKKKENVTIMADMRGEKVTGLVVISAEPRQFTVISIEGPIDIDRLADLEGHLGIPEITKDKKDHDND
ncbi:MAG TPA: DUF4252 domain-containing protein [Thermoanaerobaculia bacterium]|nr:DUF4252 domain-containing protein [Thermoanaerobaculia bacterium]